MSVVQFTLTMDENGRVQIQAGWPRPLGEAHAFALARQLAFLVQNACGGQLASSFLHAVQLAGPVHGEFVADMAVEMLRRGGLDKPVVPPEVAFNHMASMGEFED